MEPVAHTFDTTDKLQLRPFCERLQRFVMVEDRFVEGSLVIALDAEFGAGKTTFLQMWKSELPATRTKADAEGFSPMPIMLNAWESDYAGDPLVAILGDLIAAIAKWQGKEPPTNGEKLRAVAGEAVKDIGWFTVGLVNSVIAGITKVEGLGQIIISNWPQCVMPADGHQDHT
jgi:hypothetical protein